MTAKEFIEKEGLEYSLAEYDEGGFCGIDERLLEQKLEEYHQSKLKLLGIGVVVGLSKQSNCVHCYEHILTVRTQKYECKHCHDVKWEQLD